MRNKLTMKTQLTPLSKQKILTSMNTASSPVSAQSSPSSAIRAAIYARVSTEGKKSPDGTRLKGQTVDPQLLELRDYCARQGWNLVGEWTDVMSGTKAARPGLDSLLVKCRGGEVDVILVVKLDRLGRSLLNVVRLVEELDSAGCAVVCTSQGIDTRKGSPCGRMILQIMAAFAEFERALISERTVAGLVNARVRGKVLGKPNALLVPAVERPAVVALWRMRGRPGGLRGLGRLLGGVSQTWAWKIEKQVPQSVGAPAAVEPVAHGPAPADALVLDDDPRE